MIGGLGQVPCHRTDDAARRPHTAWGCMPEMYLLVAYLHRSRRTIGQIDNLSRHLYLEEPPE